MVFLLLLRDVSCSATLPYSIWATDWRIVGNHQKKSLVVVTSTEFVVVLSGGCRAEDTGNSGLLSVLRLKNRSFIL